MARVDGEYFSIFDLGGPDAYSPLVGSTTFSINGELLVRDEDSSDDDSSSDGDPSSDDDSSDDNSDDDSSDDHSSDHHSSDDANSAADARRGSPNRSLEDDTSSDDDDSSADEDERLVARARFEVRSATSCILVRTLVVEETVVGSTFRLEAIWDGTDENGQTVSDGLLAFGAIVELIEEEIDDGEVEREQKEQLRTELVLLAVDSVPPTIEVISPLAGTQSVLEDIDIAVRATDADTGVLSVVANTPASSTQLMFVSDELAIGTLILDVGDGDPNELEVDNAITAVAQDRAGNQATASTLVVFKHLTLPGVAFVRFADANAATDANAVLTAAGYSIRGRSNFLHALDVRFPAGVRFDAARLVLGQLPGVLDVTAQPIVVFDALEWNPFDLGEAVQNVLLGTPTGPRQMGLHEAWAFTPGSRDVVVAVVDTGVDYTHPDLVDNVWINRGEDANSNGVIDPGEDRVSLATGVPNSQIDAWEDDPICCAIRLTDPGAECTNFDGVIDGPDLDGDGIRTSEDRNGNGRFDPTDFSAGGDLDGIDNDCNGYVDDVVGYDFGGDVRAGPIQRDPFPLDVVGHGTPVASLIGATGDNGRGIIGASPVVSLMAVKIDRGDAVDGQLIAPIAILDAIAYAVTNGAHILNNSWSGSQQLQGGVDLLEEAVRFANDQDRLFVASASNGGVLSVCDSGLAIFLPQCGVLFLALQNEGHSSVQRTPAQLASLPFGPPPEVGRSHDGSLEVFPADYEFDGGDDTVLTVAALDENDSLAIFSDYGVASVDIAAPGTRANSVALYANNPVFFDAQRFSDFSVCAPLIEQGASFNELAQNNCLFDMHLMGLFGGTSAAAPYVAGIAALGKAWEPTAGGRDLKKALVRPATTFPPIRDLISTADLDAAAQEAEGYGWLDAFDPAVVRSDVDDLLDASRMSNARSIGGGVVRPLQLFERLRGPDFAPGTIFVVDEDEVIYRWAAATGLTLFSDEASSLTTSRSTAFGASLSFTRGAYLTDRDVLPDALVLTENVFGDSYRLAYFNSAGTLVSDLDFPSLGTSTYPPPAAVAPTAGGAPRPQNLDATSDIFGRRRFPTGNLFAWAPNEADLIEVSTISTSLPVPGFGFSTFGGLDRQRTILRLAPDPRANFLAVDNITDPQGTGVVYAIDCGNRRLDQPRSQTREFCRTIGFIEGDGLLSLEFREIVTPGQDLPRGASDLALDPSTESLYVSSYNPFDSDGKVFRVSTNGALTEVAGGHGDLGMIDFGPDGIMYYLDSSTGTVSQVDTNGQATVLFQHTGSTLLDLTVVPENPDRLDPTLELSAGISHSCVVAGDNSPRCWGDNQRGQVGSGSAASFAATASQVIDDNGQILAGVIEVSAGDDFTCAALASGRVGCWGTNDDGRLGLGIVDDALEADTARLVPGIFDAVGVAAGWAHACALHQDGRVSCWGANDTGQLGTGTTVSSAGPVPVIQDFPFVEISAGGFGGNTGHTCGMAGGGSVFCWGDNFFGQLGDGTTTMRAQPAAVQQLAPALSVSAGGWHTCAITGLGEPKCWGWGESGALGDLGAAGTRSTVPIDSAVPEATWISAGPAHTCAVEPSGISSCWGWNVWGQLGQSPASGNLDPFGPQAINLPSGRQISAGNTHTCALAAAGSVSCFGAGSLGRLGGGDENDSPEPVGVIGLP